MEFMEGYIMKMKKVISMVMATTMLMSTSVFATELQNTKYANSTTIAQDINYNGEKTEVVIISDTNEETITLITSVNEQYLVIRDNIDNTALTYDLSDNPISDISKTRYLNTKNLSNNVVYSDFENTENNYTVVDGVVSNLINDNVINENEGENIIENGARSSKKQDTVSNYEYTKTYGSPNKWQLRRPKTNIFTYYYFDTTETASNSSDLTRFYNAVEDVNTLEKKAVVYIGSAGLSAFLTYASIPATIASGGILSPATVAAGLAAVGATTAATTTLVDLSHSCSDAYDAYFEVLYN